MRLLKGDNVEVMNKRGEPLSWRPAQILSGNGHIYRVQYYNHPGKTGEQIEMVSRKFVRPWPPLLQGVNNCNVGDLVEVFYEYAWKVATILKVLEGKKEVKSKKAPPRSDAACARCLVRLLGCSQEVMVDGSNIRMRQTWHDGEWNLVRKSSRDAEVDLDSGHSIADFHKKTTLLFNPRSKQNPQNEATFLDSRLFSSQSLKRKSPYSSSIIEARNGHLQKLRAIEKDGKQQRDVAAPMLKKVNAVNYTREILGNKNVQAAPFKILSTGYNQMERAEPHDVLGNSGLKNSKNNSGSDACSVGSCSTTDQSPNGFYIPFVPLIQKEHTLSSDAESRISSGPPKEEVQVSIRWLEVHAYRSTLEALYASGPLSWDQEALLTNLRIMLHISNDEHLMELKHLVSVRTATNVS